MAPPKVPFLSANFSAIAHATEDVEKVAQSLGFLVGCVSTAKVHTTRQYLKGHHGNMITTISAKLSRKELPSDALAILSQKLSESDRRFLSDHISSCVDEDRVLYLRFDKQEALLGKVRLQEGDPIRLKLKFAPEYDREAIASLCTQSGLVS